jgi:sporulation protein YlmC with PRC-barrel domain
MELKSATWMRAAFVPAIALSLTAQVLAANDNMPTTQKPTATQSTQKQQAAQKQSYRGMRATQLIGMDVKSPEGKKLGEISDLIVDMNSANVRYAILAFDPGIFSGERLFAVPTSELRSGRGKNEVVYNMSRERLEKAGVEKNRWPGAVRDRDYLAGLDRTYGVVQPSEQRRAYSASELLGKDVNGRGGDDIGEIRDLVIDMNGQRVHYAVLAFDPSWAAPEKLFAFPVSAFRFTDGKDELAVDVDKSRLQTMRSFDQRIWTGFATPAFVTDIDRYLITITPVSADSATRGQTKGGTGASSATGSGQASAAVSSSPEYTASMKRLQSSAQKLRESIQAMAQQPAGERRNQAIKEAQQALYDTNQAMIQLPPELRSEPKPQTGKTGSSAATGSTGSAAASQAEYGPTMEKLQKSAQQLRESIQAMAQQTPAEARNQAIKEAHQALYDVNAAMAWVAANQHTQNQQTQKSQK